MAVSTFHRSCSLAWANEWAARVMCSTWQLTETLSAVPTLVVAIVNKNLSIAMEVPLPSRKRHFEDVDASGHAYLDRNCTFSCNWYQHVEKTIYQSLAYTWIETDSGTLVTAETGKYVLRASISDLIGFTRQHWILRGRIEQNVICTIFKESWKRMR